MAPKQPCAKFQYVVTPEGPKILPVDEPACKDEESPADYNAGGYLPVRIGDHFNNNRYRVIRKLGWGHFSTVWLVKDNQTLRHSALKVVKSAGRYAETARDEIKLLSRVSAFSPLHPGRRHIVSFLDSFSQQGPESSHVCIVFEPLGENLLALIERNKKKGVPRSLVKVIAKQILLGLEYLHDECDLVHTDIKPENILISIPDIEVHIENELSLSPSPTSRRVGIPLPVKSRAGVSIPHAHQRTRRQVQIFDSQPLSSPSRSGSVHGHAGFSIHASLDNSRNGSAVHHGSSVAHPHTTRTGAVCVSHSSGTVASFSSSAPKVPSGLSASAPRNDPFPNKTAKMLAAKGITAVPSRVINSPSTSSSSSSISSALASTTAGSSSLVSTPPTSLSNSLGNAVMEFMGTGKFENELRTMPRVSPPSQRNDFTGGAPVNPVTAPAKANPKSDLEAQLSSAISSSLKSVEQVAGSWKDKVSSSFGSFKSASSRNKTCKHQSIGHTRSHSGLSNTTFWKDLGTGGLAPAILVSAVATADGRQDDFSKVSTVDSTTLASSSTTATVRPSPIGTPLPITRKSGSLVNSVTKLINETSNLLSGGMSPHDSTINDEVPSPSNNQQISLLTQSAPHNPAPSGRGPIRVSPPQQVSQLSAHMHLHRPMPHCTCSDQSHKHTHSSDLWTKTKSRSSRLTEHPPISSVIPVPSTSTSVTPTPASPAPAAPPSTPVNSPVSSSSAPLPSESISQEAAPQPQLPPLQTANDQILPPPISIKIADLGNATPSKKHFTEDIQTRQYRAPEAILGRRDWDARADVWSVACVIFELLTAEYLFDPQGQGELFTKDDDHMAQIIELLGDFPLEVKMGGKYSRELFDQSGSLRYIKTLKPWPLKRVMVEKYLFSDADASILCDFLEPMLAVDMRMRVNARDMKNHKWLEPTAEDGIVTEW